MRLHDLCESHGEIDIIRQRIRDLRSAETMFDFKAGTVTLFFDMSDEEGVPKEGKATFRAMSSGLTSAFEVLTRKLSAAARSQKRGAATHDMAAQMKACEHVGPNAIRILTNPETMVLSSLKWNGVKYG